MAIHRLLFLVTILVAATTISVNARPCKTILFITSSSSSSLPTNQNPNFLFPNPRFITFSYTHQQPPFHKFTFNKPDSFLTSDDKSTLNYDSSVGNSIRDRTLDILSIVSALLFGVGCGALAAATMYLMWYICSARGFDLGVDDEEDEVSAAKNKLGYVAVPVDVPAPVKQVE
ncbi:uncharacterized protein LOC141674095 [Apium graveolens]|uniref:uncharacterized protein LOC141674095 n=1 Tax=Apium graveolens TaxID=4045 RepID=UPI003D78D1C4